MTWILRLLRRSAGVPALSLWLLATGVLVGPGGAFAQDSATLIADRIALEGDARLVADGAVEVLFGKTRLRASRITYDRATGGLTIDGPITLLDGDNVLILADAAELDADLRNGLLLSARLVLDQQLQLAAARVRRVEGRYTELENTIASTCRVCAARPVALWSIRARRVIHDQQERQLYFDRATFRVMDIPVFYLPRLRLPDPTVTRASGFLVPDIRTTSQLGTGLKLPYFLTFGPSRDLTLTPYLSPHTRTLEWRYRQAFRTGRVEFDGAFSNDDVLPGKPRGYLFGHGDFVLPRDFRLSFAAELTSDPAYLLDYGYSAKDRLSSFLRIDRVRRNERMEARLIGFRTLRDSEIPIEDTLPNLLGTAVWERRFPGIAGGEGRLALTLQGYQRVSNADHLGRDAFRLGLETGWRRALLFGPGIEAGLEARLNADGWFIGQDSSYPDPFLRVTPALSATLRWPLARQLAGGKVSVIEPVAQIAWSDSYGQSPPNEDSALVEFDEGNLLALNRFPGHDRAESGLRGVLGLNWTLMAPDGWSMSASVGRVFRAAADPDFTAASGLDGTGSDWLAAFHLRYGEHLTLTSRSLVDDGLSLTKSETRLAWQSDRATLAGSYVWVIAEPAEGRADRTNELTLDTTYRLAPNWTGAAGLRYDLDSDRAAAASLGLGFRNECVSFDLSLSRRFTSSTSVTPTTDVGFKISLGGFGRDGWDYRSTCGG